MLRNNLQHILGVVVLAVAFAAQSVSAQGVVIETAPAEATTDSTIYYDDDSAFFVEPAPEDVRLSALETILPNYNDWTIAQLNGRLKLKGLPVTPSVRIYMEKGKKISISVRASFLGEVGRIDVEGDSILAVNKMKRTYCIQKFGNIKYDYPDIISDVQSLMLDRIVIPQAGELKHSNADFVDINLGGSEETAWIIDFPKGLSASDTMGMRYAVNPDGLISHLVGFMLTAEHQSVLNIEYDYRDNGYDMAITFIKDEKPQFATVVNFDSVQWDAKEPAPVQLNSKYRQMELKDFIRSFKF